MPEFLRGREKVGRIIGQGIEGRVFARNDSKDKVDAIKFSRADVEEIHRLELAVSTFVHTGESVNALKQVFYSHKILHILNPSFFPDFHFAGKSKDETLKGTVRHRIHFENKIVSRVKDFLYKRGHPMEDVEVFITQLENFDIKLFLFDNDESKNFERDTNGSAVYLDTTTIEIDENTIPRFEKLIDELQINDEKRLKIILYLNRMIELKRFAQ